MKDSAKYHIHVSARHRLLDLHIGETFKYRDLIFLFVKRDFTSKYKQTFLGPLWALVQPLLTTIVFTIIFGNLAGLTRADAPGDYLLPGFLFYMAGSICWNYFSSVLNSTSNTFLYNRSTMGKVYYPRLVAPIATAFGGLISFGIQFLLFAGIWTYYLIFGETSIVASPALLLIPVCILQMMLLSVGCGIIISSVTTKYRDLAMLVTFGLQLWQYASPIAYGLELIPKEYLGLYMINPVTSIITTFRYAAFGFGFFDSTYYIYSWAVTIGLFFIGLVLFSRIERSFMDTI